MKDPLVFAIGDIHGRLDLFEAALEAIEDRADGAPRTVVALGDIVDRGPGSAALIERIMALEGPDFICLMGNHEALMVEAQRDGVRSSRDLWLSNGGMETLDSYGGRPVPAAHLDWLAGLPLRWSDGRRDYVHAGVEPYAPIEGQRPASLLWIRDRFLAAPAEAFERHVVHGHTPRWRGKPDPAEPERLAHRTNLDTGAWMTGVLSVGVFDPAEGGGPMQILAVRGAPAR